MQHIIKTGFNYWYAPGREVPEGTDPLSAAHFTTDDPAQATRYSLSEARKLAKGNINSGGALWAWEIQDAPDVPMSVIEGPLFTERPTVPDLVDYLHENGIATVSADFKGPGQCGRLEHGDLVVNLYTKGTALIQGIGLPGTVETLSTLLSTALWNVKGAVK